MSTRKLAQLRRQLKRAHVTQAQIALVAGVTSSHVSHVLAGRFTSRKVLVVAAQLLAEGAGTLQEVAS